MSCNACEDKVLEAVEAAQSLRPLEGHDWRIGDDGREHWARRVGDAQGPQGRRILYKGMCGVQFWRGYGLERG